MEGQRGRRNEDCATVERVYSADRERFPPHVKWIVKGRDKYGTVKQPGLANHFGFQAENQSGGGTKPNREEVQVDPSL